MAAGFREFKSRHGSVQVLVEAGKNFRHHQMKLSCAYFTYHAFIATFALILLASALLGFILKSDPDSPSVSQIYRKVLMIVEDLI